MASLFLLGNTLINSWSSSSSQYQSCYSLFHLSHIHSSRKRRRSGCCCCNSAPALLAAAVIFSSSALQSPETLLDVPQTLSGTDGKQARIQRPKSTKAESCTIKCVTTCIRGGAGSPGEGPLNVRRSLPRTWEAKVTAIQEAKDLNTLPLEELLGSLMTHELSMMQHQEDEIKKKRTIALKSTTSPDYETDDSEDEDQDEEMALITRKFKKFLRKRKQGMRKKLQKGSKKDAYQYKELDL
ncbi:uncharacterized protein [Elaeis guineensis]|uniref:uncharacterized protein n=1 Tax=Elaeis guineensis var. tenera TaxID=51953 RepID=UPI003C6DA636